MKNFFILLTAFLQSLLIITLFMGVPMAPGLVHEFPMGLIAFFLNELGLFMFVGLMAGIGIFVLYFPISIIFRLNKFRSWSFILAATLTGSLWSLFLCSVVSDMQDDPTTAMMVPGLLQRGMLVVFPALGFLTGAFHSVLLNKEKTS